MERASRRRLIPTIFGRSARAIPIGNPFGYLLIPLLLGATLEEANDDHGHVVTAHAACLRVGCQAVVHHVLADLLQVLLRGDAATDKLNHGLGGLAVPDT